MHVGQERSISQYYPNARAHLHRHVSLFHTNPPTGIHPANPVEVHHLNRISRWRIKKRAPVRQQIN